MKAASIAFRNVSKLYGEIAAVKDVSFAIAEGTLVTLLGPSGCGKTTTLRMIAGLELPTTGTIAIGGNDVTRIPASERDVSMVFQSYALFPHMTVLDNVSYGLTVARLPKAEVAERAHAALATVGLTGFDTRLPSELSGGQQQRVAVARALVLEPGVLLFDEPLSNLDARLRRQMREEIRDLQQRLSLTVVYVTHDQSEAMAVSDRIIVMNKATIAQEGAPRDLYEQPSDVFVAGFMGDANRVRGMLTRIDDRLGELAIGPLTVRLAHRGLANGAVDVSIRPEAIELRNGNDADGALAGTVRKAAYIGGSMEYTVDTAIGQLFIVSMAVDRPLAVGASVSLALANHGVVPIASA
ncbi:MAG TPA: ABC transporter ATP-binding protein [Casimicrobiaceae bacterium]|jgi:iron(III) transport system ATP-binding protein|nr:ABC transporter ATP-binding protein [Casimicrobiaceae bacterium]